jgi:SagB-type dehydrogenase family enzyme
MPSKILFNRNRLTGVRMIMNQESITATDYHLRSKHHMSRYAMGPGGLDWATQPDPFRRYAGCRQFPLTPDLDFPDTGFDQLYQAGAIPPQPLTRTSLSQLLQLSMGLSAWKVYGGSRWALRNNPSSGNLHPTEAYVIQAACEDLPAGVFHYVSEDHSLELRAELEDLSELLPDHTLLMGLSSIHWREAWKYGERAYRYCQHDTGHAMAAIRYAAALLGWKVRLLDEWSDDAIAACFGIDRANDFESAEREAADLMLLIETLPGKDEEPRPNARTLCEQLKNAQWQGKANILSPRHSHDWPVIDLVSKVCKKPETEVEHQPLQERPEPELRCRDAAAKIIMQRRSAQAFDGISSMSPDTFSHMLSRLLPAAGIPPHDLLTWQPRIHPVFFVHRVDGLEPGVYALPRSDSGEAIMRHSFSDSFEWQRPEGLPDTLPLYRLLVADCRSAANALSCHQDIASDSAFALAMLAEFDGPMKQGDWIYRQLFWEAGMLGQVLYLEAEAAGVRATGIGCYFDDSTHEVLGITDTKLQDMYHFTVGTPIVDQRLTTLAPYEHLKAKGGD